MTNYNDGQMQWISEEIGRELGRVGSEGLIRAEVMEQYDLSRLQFDGINKKWVHEHGRNWFISTPLDARGKWRGWRIIRSDKATKAQIAGYQEFMERDYEGTKASRAARWSHPSMHKVNPWLAKKVELETASAALLKKYGEAIKSGDKKAQDVVMGEIRTVARAMAAL